MIRLNLFRMRAIFALERQGPASFSLRIVSGRGEESVPWSNQEVSELRFRLRSAQWSTARSLACLWIPSFWRETSSNAG